jgi:hypothetical protein
MIAAAQSSSSFIPSLGREAARVFTLNLRNRLIFKAADEEGTIENRDFLGKRKTIKKSWGYSAGKRSAHTANRKSRRFQITSAAKSAETRRRYSALRAWL